MLLVLAVSPHGFAWLRRVIEENVDLNRNEVDFAQPLTANTGYAELPPHHSPPSLNPAALARADAAITAYRQTHGEPAERVARSTGQYTHPGGIFHGGSGPLLARRLGGAKTAAIVDRHTGLGPFGYGEPIGNHVPGSD